MNSQSQDLNSIRGQSEAARIKLRRSQQNQQQQAGTASRSNSLPKYRPGSSVASQIKSRSRMKSLDNHLS